MQPSLCQCRSADNEATAAVKALRLPRHRADDSALLSSMCACSGPQPICDGAPSTAVELGRWPMPRLGRSAALCQHPPSPCGLFGICEGTHFFRAYQRRRCRSRLQSQRRADSAVCLCCWLLVGATGRVHGHLCGCMPRHVRLSWSCHRRMCTSAGTSTAGATGSSIPTSATTDVPIPTIAAPAATIAAPASLLGWRVHACHRF